MTTIVRDNERSHAIDLISLINTISMRYRYNLQIKKAGGERTISTKTPVLGDKVCEDETPYYVQKKKVMFPDVVLYGDLQKTEILQGWELKLPDTLITDETFIKDAQRKALALGLNSFFIWNFTSGVLYVKNSNGQFEIIKQWNDTNHIKNRIDVETYRDDWEKEIEKIIIDINGFFLEGKLKGSLLSKVISDTIISALILKNKKLVANELKICSTRNTVINAYIEQWWKEVENEYIKDENDKYNAYAKIIILNWTTRIIFAHLIKKYHNYARMVEKLSISMSLDDANDIFKKITAECDFYSIFSEIPYNTNIPVSTWIELIELNTFLEENDVDEIEQSTLQQILEITVATSKREFSGQYTTPSVLAEILAKVTITNLSGNIIDPCCGTGSISKESLIYKKEYLGMEQAVSTTWASDKYSYPLQVANISLTSPESINIPNRIFQQNALNLHQLNDVKIVNPSDGCLMTINVPKFDAVLSNLPFISFEIIRDDDKDIINTIISDVIEKTGCNLSKKSDIYCFLIFTLYKTMSERGRAGFISSNSWLGTMWGKDFYKALNFYYHVEQIHISGKGKWFNNAQVVTTMFILNKKTNISAPNGNDNTSFYIWKKSLAEIKENKEILDCIVNSSLLRKNLDFKNLNISDYRYNEIINILDLNISLNALFHKVSWLNEISSCLVPINKIFDVIRGERRGWDRMFYPEEGHGIDAIYIKRVLKNARSVKKLIAEADNDAFCCDKSIEELKEKNHLGTLNWIAKFKSGVNNIGKPLIQSLARNDMYWYEMKTNSTAEIFTMMNPDKRLFFARFDEPTFINQRLIGLRKTDEYADIELNHALLNSILGMFYIEAVGFGRGLGALDINKDSVSKAFMLDPHKVNDSDRILILEKFETLLAREVKTTKEELESEDRKIFDRIVLRAFNIEAYYENIKTSLISMQDARLSVKEK